MFESLTQKLGMLFQPQAEAPKPSLHQVIQDFVAARDALGDFSRDSSTGYSETYLTLVSEQSDRAMDVFDYAGNNDFNLRLGSFLDDIAAQDPEKAIKTIGILGRAALLQKEMDLAKGSDRQRVASLNSAIALLSGKHSAYLRSPVLGPESRMHYGAIGFNLALM